MAAVATRRASAELIKAVLESSLLNKVAYRGVLSGWSLAQSVQFDVILAREYRKRTKNMATSQEANLFIPAALGGLGFRLYESPLELRVAATAMINRAARHAQVGKIGKHVDLWATSLLEYASLEGSNLSQPASLKRAT